MAERLGVIISAVVATNLMGEPRDNDDVSPDGAPDLFQSQPTSYVPESSSLTAVQGPLGRQRPVHASTAHLEGPNLLAHAAHAPSYAPRVTHTAQTLHGLFLRSIGFRTPQRSRRYRAQVPLSERCKTAVEGKADTVIRT